MLTANEKLDLILKFLNESHLEPIAYNKGTDEDGRIYTSVASSEFDKHWKDKIQILIAISVHIVDNSKIEHKELELILEYLLDEKLITSKKEYHQSGDYLKYTISYPGRMLIENGGHTGKEIERNRINALAETQATQGANIVLLTRWVAAGTIIQSFCSIGLLLADRQNVYVADAIVVVFLLLSGALIALIIFIIVSGMTKKSK